MSEITKTMKLRLYTDNQIDDLFTALTNRYASACNCISDYIFDNGFPLNYLKVHKALYRTIRKEFELKSQLTISAFKTVVARYKTVQEQLEKKPYKYKGDDGITYYIQRTLEWLWRPIHFMRPQADLVFNRDYSFVGGLNELSINTLGKRIHVKFSLPKCFSEYFDKNSGWKFGTGKLVRLKGIWYFHIPMTKTVPDTFDDRKPEHIVGIDRGLRFLTTTYDNHGKTEFVSGKKVMEKRAVYNEVRAELQSKGTKSAKRVLKRISGRENRWMTDVNHRMSKALVQKYGPNTLFVIEDLTGVSFNQTNLSHRNSKGRNELSSWAFYQYEQFLTYKAAESGSGVLKVPANYTSQRCPKCGRIHKENRDHEKHLYICDKCGYQSNDDRVGSMNIEQLGEMYASGIIEPSFGISKAT